MIGPSKRRSVAITMLIMACVYLISDNAALSAFNRRELIVEHVSAGNDTTTPSSTTLEEGDLIYKGTEFWNKPIVIEEYNLILFNIPKVASSELKILSRRMMRYDNWDTFPEYATHDPSVNGLSFLHDYPLDVANEMMNSEKWTRAVFVREPKGRLLSAYLNKFVKDGDYFVSHCCKGDQYCEKRVADGDAFDYFLEKSLHCRNPHWMPQAEEIDEKWWSHMSFVGKMENAAADAERLLKSITSSKTGETAWEEAGKSGWMGNKAFLVRDEAPHATHADNKMKQYYTPCAELFVEEHWHSEWEHEEVFSFEKFHIFDEESYNTQCPSNVGMEDLTENA